MGEQMSILEFLSKLEKANGDQVMELIHKFQCGGIFFTDIDYEVGDE